ncbi:hypothetical protein K440DRAFT_363876 [Wilcoxina mikolae CBS 423.85]|nr:hypothetical protein K440DRAFT_363876 [Wilcoxina mikolae CBS 423.85]
MENALHRLPRFLRTLLRIAGYTWFKTYRTIEMLDSTSDRTVKWLEHKQSELNFGSLIGGLLASAVTASFSWPDVAGSHWLVRACWYVSLSMVITSVLVAFQQVAGLGGILATHHNHEQLFRALVDSRGKPHWRTVFVLQVPVQLLSYSIFFYTLGLAVHVFSPLRQAWSDSSNVAVFYGVWFGLTVGLFMIGSHYSLQLLETPDGVEETAGMKREGSIKTEDNSNADVVAKICRCESE